MTLNKIYRVLLETRLNLIKLVALQLRDVYFTYSTVAMRI